MEIEQSKKQRLHSLLLVITAWIWGTAFVAQSAGGDLVGPYTFNCIRSLIGGVVLLPVIRLSDRLHLAKQRPANRKERRLLLAGGIACGAALAVASNLQQMGMYLGASAGKAGFLTACYILLVPVFGLFLGKKCRWNVWAGIVAAVCGLYLLCIHGELRLEFSDALLLACAVSFAVHILVIDYFAPMVDGVRMSCIQFLVSGLLSFIPMFAVDMKHSMTGIVQWAPALADPYAWISILYAGVLSCGVAYTLQILGQRGVHPATASLLMSLESVFSVLAGWVLLKERLSGRELAGCVLIFGAVVLAQMPVGITKNRNK
ncbi:MAG: DMT family transporter [Eubacterium sp.]|nr:DMT family transporter [Eubacterium sp.]